MKSETHRLSEISGFYADEYLDIDRDTVRFLYTIVKPFFRGMRALEMGVGDGSMTRDLAGDFSELTVIDGSEELLDKIPSAPNLTKAHALFEDYAPEKKFDTILMMHVLEHVEHPVAVLKRARQWLAPEGIFILGVPNANSIHRRVAVKMGMMKHPGQLNERDIAVGHRRVYTPETFKADIEAAGLKISTTGGAFLKPLSNAQIQKSWTPPMIEGFFELGRDLPDLAAEIYAVCERS
jgi:2-polyprenyl-3-methyl-5-hydroxy-6-metoxy-1,4-benzoquinol methylase